MSKFVVEYTCTRRETKVHSYEILAKTEEEAKERSKNMIANDVDAAARTGVDWVIKSCAVKPINLPEAV